jgi:hypothetical protein
MSLRHALICFCFAACGLSAQTDSASGAAPSTTSAPSGSNWTYHGLRLSGMADAYYNFNFNHPDVDHNDVRTFDSYANRFDLNMAKFGLEYLPAPFGFRLDAGAGEGFNVFHSFDPNRDAKFFHHVLQAYVSLKPKSWKGLQIDAGKFYTSAGAEVTEAQLNFNYTRSLLYALGPFYHVGIRASMPVNKYFTGGVQLVNGWNNLADNNTGKTMGFNGTLTLGRFTWVNNYYAGPEHTHNNAGWRHFYDTVVTVAANSKTSAYLNFDYGADRNALSGVPAQKFYGIAGAVRYALSSRFAIAPRLEYYNDCNGWATGTAQQLKEFTFTGEYKIAEGLLSRLEYRRDWSDQPFFHRGNGGSSTSQPTLAIALVAFFGPKQ